MFDINLPSLESFEIKKNININLLYKLHSIYKFTNILYLCVILYSRFI